MHRERLLDVPEVGLGLQFDLVRLPRIEFRSDQCQVLFTVGRQDSDYTLFRQLSVTIKNADYTPIIAEMDMADREDLIFTALEAAGLITSGTQQAES